VYASIGCVEICGGPTGFVEFNNYLIELSGPTSTIRAEQLKEIGAARNISIEYEKAIRPPIEEIPMRILNFAFMLLTLISASCAVAQQPAGNKFSF
jgi:hypothetical protein